MDASLLDDVYECAFLPDAWSDVLARLAAIAGARSGWMMVSQRDKHQFVGSNPIVCAVVEPIVVNGVVAASDRYARLCRAEHPGFLRERDVYTEDELEADPFYAKYVFPRGLGHAAATTFVLPTRDRVLISLERERAQGPVEAGAIDQLDALRPHVARAALIAARLQLQSAISATAALAALGLPAAAFDEQGRTLVANSLMEGLPEIAIWGAFDRLVLADKAADRQLRKGIAELDHADGDAILSFPVRDEDGRAVRIAHLIPFRGGARDIFFRGFALLALCPVPSPDAPPVDLVRSLFDLTPTEASIARSMAAGLRVNEIARARGVSINAVRTHVRALLEKTGCNRQADVLAMMAGFAPVHQRRQ
jgi:DNA-binding CsgD family transcriptional regulator